MSHAVSPELPEENRSPQDLGALGREGEDRRELAFTPKAESTEESHSQYRRTSEELPPGHSREYHDAVLALERQLLGEQRDLTRRDVAAGVGISLHAARKIWRALGYPVMDDSTRGFSHMDQEVLGTITSLVRNHQLEEDAAISITRSIGQLTDRMVVWQVEAIVEEMIAHRGLTDEEAREQLIYELPQLVEPLEQAMVYAWRRNLNAAVERLTVRPDLGPATPGHGTGDGADHGALPLARAVGFCDLVEYTSLSRQLSDRALASLVHRFERTAADIISVGGGRLVKTIGDEVLFIASTPEEGARISLALAKAVNDDPKLPTARVSLVWGRILSRLGDIYGPTVNLAARLTALAAPGSVLIDGDTAEVLADDDRFVTVAQEPNNIRGFGRIHSHLLFQGAGDGLTVDPETRALPAITPQMLDAASGAPCGTGSTAPVTAQIPLSGSGPGPVGEPSPGE